MIESITDLYNMALTHVGARRIPSPDEQSNEAAACNQFYVHSLDEVLQDHPWSCAAARATLAEIEGETLHPFDYRYALPVDPICLKVLSLIDVKGGTYRDIPEQWEKEGHTIYCNVSPCGIKFTSRVASVKDLDTHVAEIVAYKLAAKIAFRLTQSPEIESRLINLYSAMLSEAKGKETFVAASKKRPEKLWTDYR